MRNIREALLAAKNRLTNITDSASLDAQMLLGAVLDVNRAHLLAYPQQPLTPEQTATFSHWLERAAGGEPLPYILGRWPFYDREFYVSPAVLIPRPETELLLEAALAFVDGKNQTFTAVDIGTGSGALAVTLAALRPSGAVYAVDISPDALAVARRNAAKQGAAVTFFEGDLLRPLVERQISIDLLMANLPYIATADLPVLAVSRHEPLVALDGGPDGLDLVRHLLRDAPALLNPGGLALLEIGSGQGERAAALARAAFPAAAVSVLRDYGGHERIVTIDVPEIQK